MVVDQKVALTDRDTFESAGTVTFYDLDGKIYRSICATAVSKRSR